MLVFLQPHATSYYTKPVSGMSFFSNFDQIWFFLDIYMCKPPNTKFHRNPSSGGRNMPTDVDGRTDMMELRGAFCECAKGPPNKGYEKIKVFYLPTDTQKSCFRRILTFTLKQLLHVSVQSPSSGSVLFELAKVIVIKIIS